MSIIVMTDDYFEENMQFLASQFNPVLADSFRARDTAQREALAEAVRLGKALHAACVNIMYAGSDRIQELGGDCDPVSKMEAALPEIQDWLAFLAQAEQQEAQGAQAGDDIAHMQAVMKGADDDLDCARRLHAAGYRRAALATQPAAGEPIQVEAVAITREDEDGLYLDWVLEGGISALEAPGVLLLVAHGTVTGDQGSGEVYLAPPAASGEPVKSSDELAAFEKWRHTQADSLRRCGYPDGADAFIRLGSVQWAGWQARARLTAPPAAAHGDGLHFKTLEELATAIRQVSAYEDLGPELIAEEMFKQAGSGEAAHGDEAVRSRLCDAYERGYQDGQKWPDSYSLKADKDKVADELLAAMRAQGDGGGE